MARSPKYMDGLSKEVWHDLVRGHPGKVDQNQQRAIDHLTEHVRVMWNHIERLEKLLAVGNRTEKSPPADHPVVIDSARDITVASDANLRLESNNLTIQTMGRADITTGSSKSETVGGASAVAVGAAMTLTVGSNLTESIGGKLALSIARDMEAQVGTNAVFSAGGRIGYSAGGRIDLQSGSQITITGANQIAFACGSALLTLKADGTIILRGNDVTIDGSGRVNIKSASDLVLKGSKVHQN